MKKTVLVILALLMVAATSRAGGIVTNANQSAAYVRMLCRDASTGIDAVYFNPAGLMLLKKGFHLSVSNQSIWQDRNIKSNYVHLNNKEYEGEIIAPLFPSVYAAYKFDRFAVSFGFNPIGGGGGAVFDKGLPSFEYSISDLVPSLQSTGVTGYKTDIYFKGRSVYWGAQLGVSAEVNKNVSIYGGFRVIAANTTYEGYLRNNTLIMGSTEIPAVDFIEIIRQKYITGAQQATAAIEQFSQYPGDVIMPADVAALAGLPAGTTFGQAVAIMSQTVQTCNVGAAKAQATKTLLSDQEADVNQKGSAITPIFGLNVNLLDQKLNIGFKYEMPVHMKVTNNTKKDVIGGFAPDGSEITMFPDGESFYNDMPTMMSIGAAYNVSDRFLVSAGFHTYWDEAADYGKKLSGEYVDNTDLIDHNFREYALGLEYKIGKRWLVSAGYLLAQTGVKETYQTDLSNSLTSRSGSCGLAVNITPDVQLNLGGMYSVFSDAEKNMTHMLGSSPVQIVETYDKDNIILAIGADIHFGCKGK